MLLNGKDYELLRKLDLLIDGTRSDDRHALKISRNKAKESVARSHENNAKVYNLRSRLVQLKVDFCFKLTIISI